MNIYNKNDNVESQREQEQEIIVVKNQFSYKRLISYVVASVLIISVSIAYISSSSSLSLSSSSSSSSIKSTTGRQLLSDKIDLQSENVQKRTLSKRSSKKSEDTEEKSAPTPSKDYTLPTLPTIYIPTIWSPSPYPSFKPTGNYYLKLL